MRATEQKVAGQVRSQGGRFTNLDGPERTADREDVPRVIDLLVAQELGPGAVRRIAEVVGQFTGGVPPARGLRRIFPQERKSWVCVTNAIMWPAMTSVRWRVP